MRIGVPTEVKPDEFRVAATPAGVRELWSLGHQVIVQQGAGLGSSFSDEDYRRAGAELIEGPEEIWGRADLVLKVKEPQSEELAKIRSGQVLFTYLHLAANRQCTDALLASGATAIAYETVQLPDGSLPLLAPMSEVAGRMAPQAAAHFLERHTGGRGLLLGGLPGVKPATVVVLGAGVAGMNAAMIALGLQAHVILLDRNVAKLREADKVLSGRCTTVASNASEIEDAVARADVVIGAVLIPGAKAPKLVSDEMLATMQPGSVLVDISVDQGGCFESSRPTTHEDPVFVVNGCLLYCVTNMPGALPVTSTSALTNVTLPYIEQIAEHGWRRAVALDPVLAAGVNISEHKVTHKAVAEAFGLDFSPLANPS